jgi:hypothetical protein
MKDLVNKVMTEAGVTEEQATKSIESVSGYLKSKMPEAFGEQIDHLIQGGSLSEGVRQSLKQTALEARNKMEEVFKDVSEKTADAVDNIREKIDDIFKKKEP